MTLASKNAWTAWCVTLIVTYGKLTANTSYYEVTLLNSLKMRRCGLLSLTPVITNLPKPARMIVFGASDSAPAIGVRLFLILVADRIYWVRH